MDNIRALQILYHTNSAQPTEEEIKEIILECTKIEPRYLAIPTIKRLFKHVIFSESFGVDFRTKLGTAEEVNKFFDKNKDLLDGLWEITRNEILGEEA